MPQVLPPGATVDAALEEILAWPELARSPQLAKFLKYIVDARLRGDEANIKAYSIAVDVFGRPASFDPQADPIVRVQARRLRALLEEYYQGPGAQAALRFNLPVGRYVPDFVVPGAPSPDGDTVTDDVGAARARGRTPLSAWLGEAGVLAGLVIVALGIAVLMTGVLQPRQVRIDVPGVPVLAVSEFTAVSGTDPASANVVGLAVELVTDLELFDDIEVKYQPSGVVPSEDVGEGFLLAGLARSAGADVQITASLRRAGSDTALWSDTVDVPAGALTASIDDISQVFAEQLGSHRGPVHAPAMSWLAGNPDIGTDESEYICGLLFGRYRDTASRADADRASQCADALVDRLPESAVGLAMRGAMLLDKTLMNSAPGQPEPEAVRAALQLVLTAQELQPTSSLIWEQVARHLEQTGSRNEAEAAYASALQLNPANLDAEAAYGRMLSLSGASERGGSLSRRAAERSIAPPHWYFAALAVNALRDMDDAAAIRNAEYLVSGDAELASVIATVAAERSGNEQVLNRFFAQMLDVTRFRRFGIVPVLRDRIPDPALVAAMIEQLRSAGVAEASLNGTF